VAKHNVICLFILAREASYREVEEYFKHPISGTCEYHNKMLDALVTLSADNKKAQQNLEEVPSKLLMNCNKKRYWPYFKV